MVDQVDGAPAIRISGERWGGLVTRETYRDYRLVVEFRWGLATWGERRNAARDSGVLVHGQGPDGNTGPSGNGPWMRSVEAQVIEGGVGDFILVAGFDAEGRKLQPRLTARAGTDRDGEPVFDPKGEAREFESGRVNWFGRDPDWADRLGFRGKQDVESPSGRMDPPRGDRGRGPRHQHRQRDGGERGHAFEPHRGPDPPPVRGSRDLLPPRGPRAAQANCIQSIFGSQTSFDFIIWSQVTSLPV